MSTNKDKIKGDYSYTKFTTVGYFVLGALVFFAGFVYALLDKNFILFNSFLKNAVDSLSGNWREMILALSGSAMFYWIFFCIRKGIQTISNKFINTEAKDKILETLRLRETYDWIKREKQDNDPINEKNIDKYVKDECIKEALKEWLKIKKHLKIILVIYIISAIVVLILPGVPKPEYVPWFFITYTFMFIFSSAFYFYLFSKLFLKSFIRLSYSVFWPTILTIAVNLFFGLSMNTLCSKDPELSVFIPIVIFALFFIVTAIFETLSYNKVEKDKFSTQSFVWTSVASQSFF